MTPRDLKFCVECGSPLNLDEDLEALYQTSQITAEETRGHEDVVVNVLEFEKSLFNKEEFDELGDSLSNLLEGEDDEDIDLSQFAVTIPKVEATLFSPDSTRAASGAAFPFTTRYCNHLRVTDRRY